MRRDVWGLLMLVCCLCACGDSGKRVKEVDAFFVMEDFGPAIPLKGEPVSLEELWKPRDIRVSDSLLVLTDMYCDYFVQVHDKRTGRKLNEKLSRGSGPGEFLFCWSTQYGADSVWTFDLQMARINAYAKDSFLLGNHVAPSRSLRLKGAPTTVAVLPDGTFLASDLSDTENLFTRYDASGDRDSMVSFAYPEVSYDIPSELRKNFWENRIYYNVAQDKVVVFYVYTDLLEIYNSRMELECRVQGPEQFGPELGIRTVEGRSSHYLQPGVSKFSYINGVLTDSEIWTLYMGGMPTGEGDDGKLRQTLLVFDYEGHPLRHYELDRPVTAYAVDEQERCIYALVEHPDVAVVRFAY